MTSTPSPDIGVIIAYKGSVFEKDREKRKSLISELFNNVSQTMDQAGVKDRRLFHTLEVMTGTMPADRFDDLQKTLNKKNFLLEKSELKFAL